MTATPFPLAWPPSRLRTPAANRKQGRFSSACESGGIWRTGARGDLSISEALDRLEGELAHIGARYPVVSTNVEPRLDGRPRSGGATPADPGVAVYFQLKGKPTCLPCDTYRTVPHNLAAIAAHIAATRAIERHGVATVAEMFSGFVQLPPPEKPKRPWWEVLRTYREAPSSVVLASFTDLAKKHHPDMIGGSKEGMQELLEARDEAMKEKRP